MKVSENFIIQEYVPKCIWDVYKERSVSFIHEQLYSVSEGLREFYGNVPVSINTWAFGGNLEERGFRLPDTATGAFLSAHKRGMAADYTVEGIDSKQVFHDVVNNQFYFMALGVTTIESGTEGWTHLSTQFTGLKKLLIIPFWNNKG